MSEATDNDKARLADYAERLHWFIESAPESMDSSEAGKVLGRTMGALNYARLRLIDATDKL